MYLLIYFFRAKGRKFERARGRRQSRGYKK